MVQYGIELLKISTYESKYDHIIHYLQCYLVYTFLYGQVNIPDKQIPHPRILLTEEEKTQLVKNVSSDSIWSVLQQNTLEACDQLLITTPLKRKLEGIRLLGTSREVLYRIFMLSYAYRTTTESKYAKRAKAELLAVSQYSDWNPTHFLT